MMAFSTITDRWGAVKVFEDDVFLCKVKSISQSERLLKRLQQLPASTVAQDGIRPHGYIKRDVPLLDGRDKVLYSTMRDLVNYDVWVGHCIRKGVVLEVWHSIRDCQFMARIVQSGKGTKCMKNVSLDRLIEDCYEAVAV